jgi:hypothetical protein
MSLPCEDIGHSAIAMPMLFFFFFNSTTKVMVPSFDIAIELASGSSE